jgi:hypothetical protein
MQAPTELPNFAQGFFRYAICDRRVGVENPVSKENPGRKSIVRVTQGVEIF